MATMISGDFLKKFALALDHDITQKRLGLISIGMNPLRAQYMTLKAFGRWVNEPPADYFCGMQ